MQTRSVYSLSPQIDNKQFFGSVVKRAKTVATKVMKNKVYNLGERGSVLRLPIDFDKVMEPPLFYWWLSLHHFEEEHPRFLEGCGRKVEGHFAEGKINTGASAILLELQVCR